MIFKNVDIIICDKSLSGLEEHVYVLVSSLLTSCMLYGWKSKCCVNIDKKLFNWSITSILILISYIFATWNFNLYQTGLKS